MTSTRSLPFIVDGRRIEPGRSGVEITCDGGSVELPRFDAGTASKVRAVPSVLADVPLQEIVAFLSCVGEAWKDRDYPRRRLFVRQMCETVGLSEKAAEVEANLIGVLLSSYWRMHDIIEVELGSRFLLDEWVRREEAYVRAFPRGRTVHLLAGNVPLSGVASVLRALLTKNVCIVKTSAKDPVTPISLALSFLDIDPTHPVSRALNVVHWPHDDRDGGRLIADADAVCVWGGGEAVRWARAAAGDETELVIFGPRRSLAIVGEDQDPEAVATALAHDVAVYDQRACFSVRQVFVAGDEAPLLAALEKAMNRYSSLLPRGARSVDAAARFSLVHREHEALGTRAIGGPGASWSVVACAPEAVVEHPLGRMLFVHRVDSADEALRWVDPGVQTVAVAPWTLGVKLRDELARRGAVRVAELGLANVFRTGGTHDAMYPLQRLVRLVSHETAADIHGKGMVLTLDQTKMLDSGPFGEGLLEFVP